MQLPPLRDSVDARRRTQADVATHVLAQTTGGPKLFQRPPKLGEITPTWDGLLSTLDILRATWLAGFGTLPAGGRLPRRHRAGTLDLS